MVMQLVKPDRKYLPSVYEAVREYQSEPTRFDVSIVKKMIVAADDDFAHYFEDVKNEEEGIGLKPGYVAETVYWLVDGNQYIGSFSLRHRLTPYLEKIGGHIAYEIRPSARRKGYAYHGLLLCLKEASKRGFDKVLVTCNKENTASYHVMHKAMLECGGYGDAVYQTNDLVEKRVWINTPQDKA